MEHYPWKRRYSWRSDWSSFGFNDYYALYWRHWRRRS
jgi:hypothetical protein